MIVMDGNTWLAVGDPFVDTEAPVVKIEAYRERKEIEAIETRCEASVRGEDSVCMPIDDYIELMDAYEELYGDEFEHSGITERRQHG